jgi:F-type H+-transporting ATPase subunit b
MMSLRTIQRIAFFAFVANAAKAAGGGMPQLDSTWYGNQLLWLAISFALLYVLVSGFIVPSIQHVLKERSDMIDGAVAEAEKAKREAESTRGNVESAIHSARSKASELVMAAQADNNREAQEAFAKMDHELHRKSDQASARIHEALEKAHTEMGSATADLAAAITQKLIGVGGVQTSEVRKKA